MLLDGDERAVSNTCKVPLLTCHASSLLCETEFVDSMSTRMLEKGGEDSNHALLDWILKLGDICEDEEEDWFKFMDIVVSAVPGSKHYRLKRKCTALPLVAFTPSDEAFALVTIKNCYNRWIDEYKIYCIQGYKSAVPHLYTAGGGSKGAGRTWDKTDGPAEYEAICAKIKIERKTSRRKQLEERFVQWLVDLQMTQPESKAVPSSGAEESGEVPASQLDVMEYLKGLQDCVWWRRYCCLAKKISKYNEYIRCIQLSKWCIL